MRFRYRSVALGMFLALAGRLTAAEPARVANAGFEDGSGHAVRQWDAIGPVELIAVDPHTGRQAARLGAEARLSQRLARLDKGVYEWTLWARGRGRFRLEAGGLSRDLALGSAWNRYSLIFEQADTGPAVLLIATSARDEAVVDDVELTPADAALTQAWQKQQEALVQFGYVPGHLDVQRPAPAVQGEAVKPEPVPAAMREKVVFLDEQYDGSWVEDPVQVARWFVRRGFQPMNAEAIGRWMADKVKSGAYGTVAIIPGGVLPSTLLGDQAFDALCRGWTDKKYYRDALLRQYLEAGGRLLWLGNLTLYAAQGPTGPVRPFPTRGADLLADLRIDQRIYYGAPSGGPLVLTQAGKDWGLKTTYPPVRPVNLPDVTLSFLTVPKDNASQVFLKTLNPRYPLSGLVALPIYIKDPPPAVLLEDAYRLALYLGKPVEVPAVAEETQPPAPLVLQVRLGTRGDRTAFARGEVVPVEVRADNRTPPFQADLTLALLQADQKIRHMSAAVGVPMGQSSLATWEIQTDDLAVGDYVLEVRLTDQGRSRAEARTPLPLRRLKDNPFFLAIWTQPPGNRFRREAFLRDLVEHRLEVVGPPTWADDYLRSGLRYTRCIEGPEGFPTAVDPNQMPEVARRNADGTCQPNPWTPALMRTGLSHPRVIVGRMHGTEEQLRRIQRNPALVPYVLTNDDFSAYYGHDWSPYTQALFKAMTGLEAPQPKYDPNRLINVPKGIISEDHPWLAWALFHVQHVAGRYAQALRQAKDRAFPGSLLGEVPGHMQIPLWYEGLYPFYQHAPDALDLASYYYYDLYWVPLVGNLYWDEIARLGRRQGPVWTTPDCLCDEPSYLRNTLFLHLAGGISGLNYFAYNAAQPAALQEIRRLAQTVIEPLGPLLVRLQPAPKSVGLFLPLATQACDWIYPTLAVYPFANLLAAHVDVEPVCREELLAGRAFLYDAILLWNADWVSAGAAQALERYIQRGGRVVADASTAVDLPGAHRLKIDLAMGADALSQSDPTEARFGRPGIRDYLHPPRVAAVRDALTPLVPPRFVTDSPTVIVRPFVAGGVTYLWLVNIHDREEYEYLRARLGAGVKVPDPAKALEEARAFLQARGAYGGTVTATLTLPAGPVLVHDLLKRTVLKTASAAPGRLTCQVSLERLGGTLLALYPAGVERLALAVYPGSPGRAREHILECRILDTRGRLLPGLCPARVEVFYPDGQPAPYDRYEAVEHGRWIFTLTPAVNEPKGRWQVRVTELATGRQATAALDVR